MDKQALDRSCRLIEELATQGREIAVDCLLVAIGVKQSMTGVSPAGLAGVCRLVASELDVEVLALQEAVAMLRAHAAYRDRMAAGSPIEIQFLDAFVAIAAPFALIPQFRIGAYRVDFAHVPTKTAIELDGFDHHSSTADIENDRKRQRAIEREGWRVTRFGGREVHRDAAECAKEVALLIEQRTPNDD